MKLHCSFAWLSFKYKDHSFSDKLFQLNICLSKLFRPHCEQYYFNGVESGVWLHIKH